MNPDMSMNELRRRYSLPPYGTSGYMYDWHADWKRDVERMAIEHMAEAAKKEILGDDIRKKNRELQGRLEVLEKARLRALVDEQNEVSRKRDKEYEEFFEEMFKAIPFWRRSRFGASWVDALYKLQRKRQAYLDSEEKKNKLVDELYS